MEIDTYVSTTFDYSTSSNYADSYNWTIEPSNAGTITSGGNAEMCTIEWSSLFSGNAQLIAKGINDCGPGEGKSVTITVGNSFGIDENTLGVTMSLYPNPNEGTFTLELNSKEEQNITLRINDPFGKNVFTMENIDMTGSKILPLNLNHLAEGMYFLMLDAEKGTITRKVIIRK
jgi:hypothetical protein